VSCSLNVEVTFWTLLVKWTSDKDICNVYIIIYITDRSTDVWATVYSKLNKKRWLKWSRYRPGVAQRVGRGKALLFHDRGTSRGEWSAARPGCTLPPGKTRYPFYRRLGGTQGRSGRAGNLVPTVIRSRIVQPVVSRYTDWAIRPTFKINYDGKCHVNLKPRRFLIQYTETWRSRTEFIALLWLVWYVKNYLNICPWITSSSGLVVRVSGYRYRGPGATRFSE